MGFLSIRNFKTGKVYDSRGQKVLEAEGKINQEGKFVANGEYVEAHYYGQDQFELEKFLDVLYDHLPQEEKTKKIKSEMEHKYGIRKT